MGVAGDILIELIRKSGVGIDQWKDDETFRVDVANAALEMAQIVGEPGEVAMANKIYKVDETTIIFGSEAGDDVAWSTESIADAAGRQSSLHDQGAGGTARALEWMYRIYTQAQATPTVGNLLDLRLKTSDGTHPDNDDGATDAAVSSIDKLENLQLLEPIAVDEAAANIEFVSHGVIEIPHRHFGVVLWNTMGSSITTDVAETKAEFTPIPREVQ